MVCGSSVTPSNVVVSNLTTDITKTVAGCFTTLRQLRSVRRSLSRDAFTRLVVAIVLSRLDYCNGVRAGLPASQLNRLQSVLHASARMIYGARRHDHVKPLLQRLHWLSVPERVEFKLRLLHGLGLDYLSSDFVSVSDLRSRQKRRSATTAALVVAVTRHSTLGDRAFHVIAAMLWNALPGDITSATPLLTFRHKLKTFLFRRSYNA